MAKPFKKLRQKMSPEARERVDQRVRGTLLEMTLQELRQKVSGKTQVELAEFLEVTQGAISQGERAIEDPRTLTAARAGSPRAIRRMI